MNAMHLSETTNRGTPPEYVEAARYVMGDIDMDVASNAYWNQHIVKAAKFYDGSLNGDGTVEPYQGRTICNPPGDKRGVLPPIFWNRTVEHWWLGLTCTIWIGFSLEQLPRLQRTSIEANHEFHPLHEAFLRCVPRERINFLEMSTDFDTPPRVLEDPTHGNYITFLPPREHPDLAAEMGGRFIEAFGTFGAVF